VQNNEFCDKSLPNISVKSSIARVYDSEFSKTIFFDTNKPVSKAIILNRSLIGSRTSIALPNSSTPKINRIHAATAKDILITSQLRAAMIFNKNIKAANFNIDTINQKTYIFGIAHTKNEKKEIIQEAKQIVDLKELVTSILMVSDLSRQRE